MNVLSTGLAFSSLGTAVLCIKPTLQQVPAPSHGAKMAASSSRSTLHPWQRGTFCLAFSSQSPGISSDFTNLLGLMLTPECPGQVSGCDNCLTWVMCLFLDSEMGTVPDTTHRRHKNKDGGKEVPPKKVRVKRRDECWAGKSSSCPASCLNPWKESCYQYVSMRAVMLNG